MVESKLWMDESINEEKKIMRKVHITIIIYIFFSLSFYSYSAPVHPLIGYGSSDAVYSAKNQEFFLMGFTLGLEEKLKPPLNIQIKHLLNVVQLNDRQSLSALRAADKLLKENIAVLAGFPTSHEALLVAPSAQKHKTIFISAAAVHSELAMKGSYVYSLGESIITSNNALISFVNKRFKSQTGIVTIQPEKVFSKNHVEALRKSNSTMFEKLSLFETNLTVEGKLKDSVLDNLLRGQYGYILITTYADDSIQLLEQLITYNINLPLITNSAWTIGNIELVHRLLMQYKGDIYCVSSIIDGMKSAKIFEDTYSSRYGKKPESEMYYGYDLGIIVAETINRIKGKITKKKFHQAFTRNLCFDKTTTGKVCFPKEGGHVQRDMYWLKFSGKKGFKVVDVIAYKNNTNR